MKQVQNVLYTNTKPFDILSIGNKSERLGRPANIKGANEDAKI